MSITKIVNRLFFLSRQKELDLHYGEHVNDLQEKVLRHLVDRAKDTEYGRRHLFSTITDYESFTHNIPLNSYEDLKGDIDRMRHGESDILWPGLVRCFAKS